MVGLGTTSVPNPKAASEAGLRGGLVREEGLVEARAQGQRDARGDPPEVAHVEAELVDAELRRLLRVVGEREAVVELLGQPLLEQVEAAEPVAAEVVADEEVPELEELVVGADGERVAAAREREVVVELEDVLVQRVGGRELLGARDQVGAVGQPHRDLRESP